MNRKQKICLWLGIVAIVIIGIFSPWLYTTTGNGLNSKKNAGYSCILFPPPPKGVGLRYGISLDVSRLCVQWVIVAVVTGGLIVTLKDKKQKDKHIE